MKNIILILVIVPFLISCQKKHQDLRNIINLPLTSEVATLDPALSYDTVSANIVYQCYETLFEYEYLKRPYTLTPLLAEDMPLIESNGLKYTIKIKKDVRYHDDPAFNGKVRTVKAQDFVTQIKRLAFLPTNSSGWWLFKGRIKGLDAFRQKVGNNLAKMLSEPITGLYASDDHTLVIELNSVYPQLIYGLGMSFTSPLPAEAVLYYKNDFNKHPIGTGPFYLKSWENDFKLTLKKFQHYRESFYPFKGDRYSNERNLLVDARKKIPFIEEINFHVMKEAQTRWLNFLKGNIDIITLSKDHFSSAIDSYGKLSEDLRSKNIQMQISPSLTFWWLAFNMKDPVLGTNLKLRQAIAHAINVDKYIELFTNNVGQKANSIYPPGIPGYSPSKKLPFEYNLDKAKRLLAEAGYPNGKGLAVLNYDVRGDNSVARQEGEYVKSELQKIGININVVLNTFPGFLQKSHTGKLQFWQGGWTLDYPDSENVLQLLHPANFPPGPNTSYYNNDEFNQLFLKLNKLVDGDEKFQLMEKAEDIVTKDLPWVMLFYSRHYVLFNHRVKNLRHSDFINNYYKYIKTSEL